MEMEPVTWSPNSWHYKAYDWSHLALAVMYTILATYSAFLSVMLLVGKASMIRWQKSFTWLTLLGSLGRAVFFALQVPLREGTLTSLSNGVNFALNTVPSYFFFVDYLIVLFLWAEIYHTNKWQAHRRRQQEHQKPSAVAGQAAGSSEPLRPKDASLRIRKLLPVLYGVIGLLFLTLSVLVVLDFVLEQAEDTKADVSHHTNIVETIGIAVIAAFYVTSAIGFLVYGTLFLRALRRSGQSLFTVQTRRQRIILEVQVVSAIFSFCFLVRGALAFSQLLVHTLVLSALWYSDLCYYMLLEFVPLAVLMFILRPRKATPSYQQYSDSRSAFSPLITSSYQ